MRFIACLQHEVSAPPWLSLSARTLALMKARTPVGGLETAIVAAVTVGRHERCAGVGLLGFGGLLVDGAGWAAYLGPARGAN
jgi:hypothetical protein